MSSTRVESDSMGTINVPADKYYGAQTARSLANFDIGGPKMPDEIIRAFGILKKAAAGANLKLGLMDQATHDLIVKAAERTQIWVVTHSRILADAIAQQSGVIPRDVIRKNGATWLDGLTQFGEFEDD